MAIRLLVVAIALLAGCTTVQSVQSEPLDSGAARTFNAPYETVLPAAKASMKDVGIDVVSESKVEDGSVLTGSRGATNWSWGENVRVFVRPFNGSSVVRVVSEKAFRINVSADDFTEPLFTHISQRLGIIPTEK